MSSLWFKKYGISPKILNNASSNKSWDDFAPKMNLFFFFSSCSFFSILLLQKGIQPKHTVHTYMSTLKQYSDSLDPVVHICFVKKKIRDQAPTISSIDTSDENECGGGRRWWQCFCEGRNEILILSFYCVQPRVLRS